MDTHNLYLRTLFEGGAVGLAILLTVWAGLLFTGLALWRRAEHPLDEQIGVGLFVAGTGLVVANLFGDRFTYQALIAQVWTIAGVAARLRANDTGNESLEDDEDHEDAGEETDAEVVGEVL